MSANLYRKILVGIDGSEHGNHALQHAVTLAQSCRAALRIVHVLDLGWLAVAPAAAADIVPATDSWRAEAAGLLKAAAETARAAGVEAETRLVETVKPANPPAQALVEEAASWQADLLVVGARGRRGLEHLLIGSVADGVLRRSTRPVLLVH
jgi:nucleotide-binding universal stress UspA family protein